MNTLVRKTPSKALRIRWYRSTPIALLSASKIRCNSTEQKPIAHEKSFRGQVYESVSSRLARERQERKKYIEEREARPNKNYLEKTLLLLSVALIGYWLGTTRAEKYSTASTIPIAATKPPRHNVGDANLQAAWADFVEIVGKENVSTLEEDCRSHSSNSWSTNHEKDSEKPFMVVYPKTTEEVSKIMKICHRRLIPVTAYSGGTSLEGHFTATRGGICIDFGRMEKVLELNKEDMDVVVQPGVRWEELNERLAQDNLFFPPDPGPGAMIGGMVSTGCSGTNAFRYGTVRDWVLNMTVVLADGTIIKTRQRPRKSSAGYDLTRIFIGSEGTLGLITEVTLKLTAKPETTSVAVCNFENIRDAAECAMKVVHSSNPIAAIELLDDVQMRCVNTSGMTKRHWMETPTLFFKFSGTPDSVNEQIQSVQRIAKLTGSKSFEFAKNQEEQNDLWSARKQALWSTMALRDNVDDRVWTTDVAVPFSRLLEIVEKTKEDINKNKLTASILGHLGDGNFHAIILYNEKQRTIAEGIVKRMVKRAIDMEGTSTGEHGVGLGKRDYLNYELGETTVDAMRKLKLAFDPLCILNCDKVVRVEKPKPGEESTL
ncbi:D-lactate dehydrogenase, mitochondrial [Erysiphe neolycopersici]|uniref:D-lactate dehydrogenase (cytochrome) n=1 Tax=Erysiphe neolycopersici TaxID=212602 RepID=A0A420I3K0_9PEZI|nr:D-lactate dehydrogenase, mitochondrial [Erysiphe neolycopersici]